MSAWEGILDFPALHRRLKGKKKRLSRLIDTFEQHYQSQLEAIQEALAQKDPSAVALHAHTFKGTMGSFEAASGVALAFDLEQRGRQERLEGGEALLSQLQEECSRLRGCLGAVLAEDSWGE